MNNSTTRRILYSLCKNLQIFGGLVLGCIKTKFCSDVARKYAFGSIFQALQDLHTFAALESTAAISKFSQKIGLKNQQVS